jgi:hypothetical protein
MKTFFKLFGLQRSGTNYIKWLIESNFKEVNVLQNGLGRKHFPPLEKIDWKGKEWNNFCSPKYSNQEIKEIYKAYLNDRLFFILAVKDPFAWFISFLKHIKIEINEENIDKGIKNYINLWNTRNKEFLNINNLKEYKKVKLVKYEELICDCPKILEEFRSCFNLEKRYDDWQNTCFRTNMGGEFSVKTLNFPFDASFYREKRYMNFFSKEQIKLINRLLDKQLINALKYENKY